MPEKQEDKSGNFAIMRCRYCNGMIAGDGGLARVCTTCAEAHKPPKDKRHE